MAAAIRGNATREETAAQGDESLREELKGWLWLGGVPLRSARKDVLHAICQRFGDRMAAVDDLAEQDVKDLKQTLENWPSTCPRRRCLMMQPRR